MITYGFVRSPVNVTGIGAVSAYGTSCEALRDGLLGGQTAVTTLTSFDVSNCRTTLAATLVGFEPTAWVPAMKLRRLDRTGVYALAAARLAIGDATGSIVGTGGDAIGVVLGTSTAGGESTQVFLDALFRHGATGAPALLFDSTVGNSAASLVAIEHRLRGPNITVAHKEAGGLAAVVTAVDLIREGTVSAVLAGGIDAIYETVFKAHDRFRVMSPERSVSSRLAPFDRAAAGFVMGEGGFALCLEANGRSDATSHGQILGVSAAAANAALNAWPTDHEALVWNMRLALEDAGVRPDEINVVYASANATALDAVEARAISQVFGDAPIVTSIKGALGEFGASGSAACAAAFLCGSLGEIPPVVGLANPCREAAALRLALRRARADGPLALVNSVASGGALFSAVLRVAPGRATSA